MGKIVHPICQMDDIIQYGFVRQPKRALSRIVTDKQSIFLSKVICSEQLKLKKETSEKVKLTMQ